MMPEAQKNAALYEPDVVLAAAYQQAAAAIGVQLRLVADPTAALAADEALASGRDLLVLGGAEPAAHAEACRAASQKQARIIILLPAAAAGAATPNAVPNLPLPLRLGALQQALLQLVQRRPNMVLGDNWLLNPEARHVQTAHGAAVALTEKEVSILLYLKQAARPVPREELLANVWGYHPDLTTHTVETHIYRLRQKLGTADLLQTTEAGYVVL